MYRLTSKPIVYREIGDSILMQPRVCREFDRVYDREPHGRTWTDPQTADLRPATDSTKTVAQHLAFLLGGRDPYAGLREDRSNEGSVNHFVK